MSNSTLADIVNRSPQAETTAEPVAEPTLSDIVRTEGTTQTPPPDTPAQPTLSDIQTPAETIQQLQPVLSVPSVAETVTQGVQDAMGIPRISVYRVPGTEVTVRLPETARRPDIGVAGYAADFASGMFEGGQDLIQFATRAIGGKYGIEDDGFRPMEDFKPGVFVPQNFVNQMF